MKFDMHCHVKEGSLDGKVTIEETIRELKKKGYDGMLISDHNTYKGYTYWKEHFRNKRYTDFVVLKGIEYDTIDAGHILVIMPENVSLKILELRGLPVMMLIDIVHRHGGILGPAHPCGERYLSYINTIKRRNQLSVIEKFDFIESFNACEDMESNRTARRLAKLFHKPGFGGSDSHRLNSVGFGYTDFKGEVYSESQLISLIKEKGRAASSCGGEYYHGTTKDKLGKANQILVQSFWFYNRAASLARRHKRLVEIKQMYIKLK